jgi:Tfp pilus assembly protein PilF
MHPSEESSYYNFALLYLEENKLEEAIRYFDIATKYDPTFAEAYYYMAYIYEKQGDINKAITYYRNAMNNGDRASRAEKALQRLGAQQ